MEDQLSATGCGVDCFREAFEIDAFLLKLSHGVNQMPEGAAKPIKSPDNKGVATAQVGERFFKARPASFRATDVIGEDSLTACFC